MKFILIIIIVAFGTLSCNISEKNENNIANKVAIDSVIVLENGSKFNVSSLFCNHIDGYFNIHKQKIKLKNVKENYFQNHFNLPFIYTDNLVFYEEKHPDTTNHPMDGGGPFSSYPIFKTKSTTNQKSIKKLNDLILTEMTKFEFKPNVKENERGNAAYMNYEVVVQNAHFVSVLLFFGTHKSNNWNEFVRSINFDLITEKQIKNSDFLNLLGVDLKNFENEIKLNYLKFNILSYLGYGKYPDIKFTSTEPQNGEESENLNRYNSDFNETMRSMSIVPVIYKNKYWLRLAIDIKNGNNQNSIGFYDYKLDY